MLGMENGGENQDSADIHSCYRLDRWCQQTDVEKKGNNVKIKSNDIKGYIYIL